MGESGENGGMRTFEWHLDAILREKKKGEEAKLALVMLNQPITDMGAIRALWQRSCLRVAADGGANRLYEISRATRRPSIFDNLDFIIGDLDSLTTPARVHYESFNTRVIHDTEQESTDFGKAIAHVRSVFRKSPVDIAAIGGLGGRVDQGLSQLHHLFLFQTGEGYDQGRIYLVSEESVTVVLKAGRHVIRVREEGEEDVFGKYVGILPVKEPSVITTRGLEWDVEEWETGFGGRMSTSNHLLPESKVVEVETSKEVLFTISLA